jgi:hypothetical protein
MSNADTTRQPRRDDVPHAAARAGRKALTGDLPDEITGAQHEAGVRRKL